MISAVVDTNIVVSGVISEKGAPRQLLLRLRASKFSLILSAEHHAEITNVLSRPRLITRFTLPRPQIEEFASLLANSVTDDVPTVTTPMVVRDAKDQHLLVTALGSKSDYLVTGDNDLLVLRDDPRLGALRIVTVAEFLDVLDVTSP